MVEAQTEMIASLQKSLDAANRLALRKSAEWYREFYNIEGLHLYKEETGESK